MNTLIKKQAVTFALLIIAFGASVYEVGKFIARERLEDLSAMLTVDLAEQKGLLVTIAETTARNGADSVTESIVRDCEAAERTEFEALLSRLDTQLSRGELTTLERLFGRCGSFYAERKSVMVSRLEREVEVYANTVEQLELLSGKKQEEYRVEVWQALVEQENAQSEQFNKLVSLQDQIIKTLLAGKAASSAEVKEIVKTAKQTQEELMNANKQASELRTALTAL